MTVTLTAEEQAICDAPFEFLWKDEDDKQKKEMRVIEKLTMMRRSMKGSKEYEYEVKFKNKSNDDNVYMSASKLQKQGFDKVVMQASPSPQIHTPPSPPLFSTKLITTLTYFVVD